MLPPLHLLLSLTYLALFLLVFVFHKRFQPGQFAIDTLATPHQNQNETEQDDPCSCVAVKKIGLIDRVHYLSSVLLDCV